MVEEIKSAKAKIRVLVVDDDEYVRQVLVRMVANLGFEVDFASGGQEAMDMLNQQDYEYDIILCDVKMPDLDGLTVLKRVKKIQPFTVFIMISGYSSIDVALQATKLGAYDYITKPFNMDQVRLSIHRGIENKKLLIANRELLDDLQKLNRSLEQKVRERTAELKLAYDELRELETLKSNFLQLVSHELNSPLTLITGYLELLDRNLDSFNKDELQGLLNAVNRGAERLKKIISDILDMTKLDSGRLQDIFTFQEVDVKKILDENLNKIAGIAKSRQLNIIVKSPRDPLIIMGDAVRLDQAFQNLFNNAIKFTPDDKSIYISLGKSSRNWAQLIIKDEGVGITKAIKEQIFQPFFEGVDILHHSTSESKFMGSGLGLGLSISQRIIQSHGGKITLKSKGADKGSTFTVTLPLLTKTAMRSSN